MGTLTKVDNYYIRVQFLIFSYFLLFLIKIIKNKYGTLDLDSLLRFINNHIPQKDSKIKGRLINDREEVTILNRLVIEPEVKTGILRFSIPDIGIKLNEGRVPSFIAKKHPELKGGEIWGVVQLAYSPAAG